MGGFTDYLRMVLGWWSSPTPIHEPLCFDLVLEPDEFSIHDESPFFSLTNDSHKFDINEKEC